MESNFLFEKYSDRKRVTITTLFVATAYSLRKLFINTITIEVPTTLSIIYLKTKSIEIANAMAKVPGINPYFKVNNSINSLGKT